MWLYSCYASLFMTYQSHQNAIVCLYNLITNCVFSNIIPWFQRYIKHTMCLARQINHVRIHQQVVKGPRSSVLNLMAPCTPQNRTHIYIYIWCIIYIIYIIQISSNHSPPRIEGWYCLNNFEYPSQMQSEGWKDWSTQWLSMQSSERHRSIDSASRKGSHQQHSLSGYTSGWFSAKTSSLFFIPLHIFRPNTYSPTWGRNGYFAIKWWLKW